MGIEGLNDVEGWSDGWVGGISGLGGEGWWGEAMGVTGW